MGMGASQARLLALTSRKLDIGRQLQHYSHVKDALNREVRKIAKNYTEALKQTTLMWSNDSGVSYTNLTYNTLMRPNASNSNKPILITNNSGKIVIDQKYKEYAELFAPGGKAGADWDSSPYKNEILSELTGIPIKTLENADETRKTMDAASLVMYEAENERDQAEIDAIESLNALDFARMWGDIGEYNFKSFPEDVINLGSAEEAAANMEQILNKIGQSMEPYLPESELAKFKEACNSFYKSYKDDFSEYSTDSGKKTTIDSNTYTIKKSGANFQLDVEQLIRGVMSYYKGGNANCVTKLEGPTTFDVVKKGLDSEEYQTYLEKIKVYDEAKKLYEQTVDVDNQVLDTEQETKLNFYNQLFIAIADNGWVEDYSVSDSEYLNQMMQNYEYCVMTMTEYEPVCECENNADLMKGRAKYEYELDIWSSNSNIFAVNTDAIRQEALTENEYQKSLISAKEKQIDKRMEDLETEQKAVVQMIEGVEKIINDNIERTCSWCG